MEEYARWVEFSDKDILRPRDYLYDKEGQVVEYVVDVTGTKLDQQVIEDLQHSPTFTAAIPEHLLAGCLSDYALKRGTWSYADESNITGMEAYATACRSLAKVAEELMFEGVPDEFINICIYPYVKWEKVARYMVSENYLSNLSAWAVSKVIAERFRNAPGFANLWLHFQPFDSWAIHSNEEPWDKETRVSTMLRCCDTDDHFESAIFMIRSLINTDHAIEDDGYLIKEVD